MRGREKAANDLARRFVLVSLGLTFFALAALMWPSQASAQLPTCPGSTPPAAPHTSCRPVCEMPSFTLTTSVGTGAGSFTATAPAPYNPPDYQTKGDPECAVPAGPNAWNVRQACTFHCVHWHEFVAIYGVPQPSATRVTPIPDPTTPYFLGWDEPASGCRPPTSVAFHRNFCAIRMDKNKAVTANFGTAPDGQAPSVPTIAVAAIKPFQATLELETSATDETWLGGYEVYANNVLRTRVNPGETTTFTIASLLCNTNYTFRIDAFDAANATPSNEVSAKTNACPKVPPNGVFHVKPPRTTKKRSAFFHWGARRGGVDLPQRSFKSKCKLDKKRWVKCSAVTGKTVRKLKPGRWHTFRVRVGDAQGWDQTPAVWRWRVRR